MYIQYTTTINIQDNYYNFCNTSVMSTSNYKNPTQSSTETFNRQCFCGFFSKRLSEIHSKIIENGVKQGLFLNKSIEFFSDYKPIVYLINFYISDEEYNWLLNNKDKVSSHFSNEFQNLDSLVSNCLINFHNNIENFTANFANVVIDINTGFSHHIIKVLSKCLNRKIEFKYKTLSPNLALGKMTPNKAILEKKVGNLLFMRKDEENINMEKISLTNVSIGILLRPNEDKEYSKKPSPLLF